VDPVGYAARRNYLDGPVTRLSPYLTHGVADVAEVVEALRSRGVGPRSRIVFELAWREYWHHVWRHIGVGILADIRRPCSRVEYAAGVPADIREGRTGVPVIDASVRALYDTGYVHNHARMWLASYVVHLRKVCWRAGADWMYGHLLDGDLASNHLSWQWVAGTFSARPYLFNGENVARYAPALARAGTAPDRTYAELERIARGVERFGPERHAPARGVREPALLDAPPAWAGRGDAPLPEVAGRDVVLVHPWALADRAPGAVAIGVLHAPFHRSFPWSAVRWAFVLERMRAVTDVIWAGDLQALVPRLAAAASILAVPTQNPGYRDALADRRIVLAHAPRAFPDPDDFCESFSRFWRQISKRPAGACHAG
jgi:deoxyribodipyrimidine photo-lyase